MATLVAPFINLAILVGILAYYLRQPLKEFVTNRHVSVLGDLKRVQDQLHKAQEQYEEFSAKLKAIDAEVQALHKQAKQDAENAKVRIVHDAKRLSDGIMIEAKSAAQGLVEDLRKELFTDLGNRVLEQAETILKNRLTGEDRARIRREFSAQVENSK